MTAEDGTVINVNQDVHLNNPSAKAFAEFSTATMLQENVTLHLHGKPQLKLGALPTVTVNYDKKVQIKGVLYLPGLKFRGADCSRSQRSQRLRRP